MANISVTYSFSNGSTADATEVNTNFQDIIDGTSDGSKDFSISALTCAGNATLNANTTIGNATSDDLTITARVASDIDPKTAANNTLGDSTQTWQALYVDNGATDGGAVYFNASTTAFLKSDASGADLDVGGFTGLDLKDAEIKRMSLYDEAKTDSYTITDTDGVSVIYMTTAGTDRTVTLPTAADNAGRVITIKKVDSGTGVCAVDGEGSETVDGVVTRYLPLQYDFMTVQCDGSAWHIIQRNHTSLWKSFTPSWTNLTASGTNAGFYRRVGENMEITIVTTVSSGSGGSIYFDIPGGYTLATEKFANGASPTSSNAGNIGAGMWYDSGNSLFKALMVSNNDTTDQISVAVATGDTQGFLTGGSLNSTDQINIHMSVPIDNWI